MYFKLFTLPLIAAVTNGRIPLITMCVVYEQLRLPYIPFKQIVLLILYMVAAWLVCRAGHSNRYIGEI